MPKGARTVAPGHLSKTLLQVAGTVGTFLAPTWQSLLTREAVGLKSTALGQLWACVH